MREAAAVTPTLFLGDHLSLDHVYVYGDASEQIRAGQTVRTDSEETCMITLLNLGVPLNEIKARISRAKVGLLNDELEADSVLVELLTDYE